MGFNQNLSNGSMARLDDAYGDINTWYAKYQPKEIGRLDSFLNDYNKDFAYTHASDRALAGVSNQLGPNVVQAGTLPNLRAQAAGLAERQAALVGGTAVGAQLGQQKNYATALKRVVQAGHAHRNMSDATGGLNQSMDSIVQQAESQARAMKGADNAQLIGTVVGAGLGWATKANAAQLAGAKTALSTNLTNAATPGFAEAIGSTPGALSQAAYSKYFSTPIASNGAVLWNKFTGWAGGTSFGRLLSGGAPTMFPSQQND